MPELTWDTIGKRFYETGTDHGVLYPLSTEGKYEAGVAWSGLTKVTESPEGGEETPLYADNMKYLSLWSVETLKGTIEAYTYPDEFADCDGSKEVVIGVRMGQQTRKPFGFSYRTRVGSDTNPNAGYKLHLIYGVQVSPSERAYETINETPGAVTFSWGFSSTAAAVEGVADVTATSVIEIDSRTAPAAKMKALEEMLYGKASIAAKLPTPKEVFELFKAV